MRLPVPHSRAIGQKDFVAVGTAVLSRSCQITAAPARWIPEDDCSPIGRNSRTRQEPEKQRADAASRRL
jgi:hypothetical protein